MIPFDDVQVDIDLHDVLTSGRGQTAAPYVHVCPLADWIEDGWVQVFAVSPFHVLPKHFLASLEDPRWLLMMSGGPSHRRLCVLATFYLSCLGKTSHVSGSSTCSYAGGWADVAAVDGTIYVECGTLNTGKPIEAMLAGETLMVIPYSTGCDELDDAAISRLDPFPGTDDADPFAAGSTRSDTYKKMMKLGRVCLGYIFVPKCKLHPNPFARPLGLREPEPDPDAWMK